jgi:cation:H+ antiporter
VPPAFSALVFLACAGAALAASAVLIVRLERIGARLAVTEAVLGLLAALAADTPEISTAVTALARGQNEVGIGVILGSNVAKLAMLLGLAAVVARHIPLDRRVVLLEAFVAVGVAAVALGVVGGTLSPAPGLALALLVFAPYVVISSLRPAARARLPIPSRLRGTLTSALAEEEDDLGLHPSRGGRTDVVHALLALVVVVVTSVGMETTGTALGGDWGLSDLVVGGVLLAIVTSIPNAVAAVYLARRGRGAATLSTTTNSNTINVVVGLLLPAALLGLGVVGDAALSAAWWYAVLTLAALAWAFVRRGLTRADGVVLGVAYLVFVVLLLR